MASRANCLFNVGAILLINTFSGLVLSATGLMLIEAEKAIRKLIMLKKSAGFSAQCENVRLIIFGKNLVT